MERIRNMTKTKVHSKPNKKKSVPFRYVCLRLCGKKLSPDRVTRLLKISPSYSRPIGSVTGESGKTYTYDSWQWSIDGKLRCNATVLNQLKHIHQQIKTRGKALKKILRVAKADLTIAIQPPENSMIYGYTLPAKLIRDFTSLGIDIRFSIHNYNS